MTNPQELIALAERVEALEGPDREMDALIAVAVYGGETVWLQANGTMEVYPARRAPSSNYVGGFAKHPVEAVTGSLDAAMTLAGDTELEMTNLYGVARAHVDMAGEYGGFHGENLCGSLPLALVAACLRALAQKETGK
jgi:hypothetical protein